MLLRRCLLLVSLVGLSSAATAEKLIGIAFVSGLTGVNLEWAGERTSYYGMFGSHFDDGGLDTSVRWVAGFRHRLDGGFTNTSGFYIGGMAGDLGADKDYERLGAGFEVGYQWVKSHTRITLGGGVAVLEQLDCSDRFDNPALCDSADEIEQREEEAEPGVILSLTISLRR